MEYASTKASRLIQLEHLLIAHSEGLRPSEIARRLGVHRSTAGRYIRELSSEIPLYDTDDGRTAIDRDIYLTEIRLTLHEVLALHLASRLLADHSDRHNPHAAGAVRKLGHAVRRIAPRIAGIIDTNADLLDNRDTTSDPSFLEALEQLTRAWADGRSIDLRYTPAGNSDERRYRMNVYHIRPYAPGRTLHVIGQCDGDGHLRTLRIDRVVEATLTDRYYEVPKDLNLEGLLRGAWGVWYGTESTEIVLQFSATVASRVRESRWHPDEVTTELPDGRIQWRTRVAEPREMYPWIRGWGSDVEIVEPRWLRNHFTQEVAKMCQIYDIRPGRGNST